MTTGSSSKGSRSWVASVVPVLAIVVASGAFGYLLGGVEPHTVQAPPEPVMPMQLAEAEAFGVLQWASSGMDRAPWVLGLVNDTGGAVWFSVSGHDPIVREQGEHFNMTKERVMVHYHVRADPMLGDAFVIHAQQMGMSHMDSGNMSGMGP